MMDLTVSKILKFYKIHFPDGILNYAIYSLMHKVIAFHPKPLKKNV